MKRPLPQRRIMSARRDSERPSQGAPPVPPSVPGTSVPGVTDEPYVDVDEELEVKDPPDLGEVEEQSSKPPTDRPAASGSLPRPPPVPNFTARTPLPPKPLPPPPPHRPVEKTEPMPAADSPAANAGSPLPAFPLEEPTPQTAAAPPKKPLPPPPPPIRGNGNPTDSGNGGAVPPPDNRGENSMSDPGPRMSPPPAVHHHTHEHRGWGRLGWILAAVVGLLLLLVSVPLAMHTLGSWWGGAPSAASPTSPELILSDGDRLKAGSYCQTPASPAEMRVFIGQDKVSGQIRAGLFCEGSLRMEDEAFTASVLCKLREEEGVCGDWLTLSARRRKTELSAVYPGKRFLRVNRSDGGTLDLDDPILATVQVGPCTEMCKVVTEPSSKPIPPPYRPPPRPAPAPTTSCPQCVRALEKRVEVLEKRPQAWDASHEIQERARRGGK